MPVLLVPSILLVINISLKNTKNNISKNINISISNKNNLFYNFLKVQNNISILDLPKEEIKTGRIGAFAYIDDDADSKILSGKAFNMNFDYNQSSINSMMLIPALNSYEISFRELCDKISEFLSNGNKLSYEQALKYVTSYKVADTDLDFLEQSDISSIYFNMLVPMMIILYCCIGSSGYACEMTAGEKERGTLEPLLSTGADRVSLVLGKLISVSLMGVISAVSTAIGLCMYKLAFSNSLIDFNMLEVFFLFVTVIMCSVFFAAINLAIGIFAKSFKEAQMYTMPLSVICLIPTYFTYFTDINSVPFYYFCIPILNVVCIIKELLVGVSNLYHIGLMSLCLFVCVFVVSVFTLKMFCKEKVIFRM